MDLNKSGASKTNWFKLIEKPGKKIAQVNAIGEIILGSLGVLAILVLSFINFLTLSPNSGFNITFFGAIVYLVLIIGTIAIFNYRTQIVLDISTKNISFEKKVFDFVISGVEYGLTKDIEIEIKPNLHPNLQSLKKKFYFISIKNINSNNYAEFNPEYSISKEEAQKIAGFLELKVKETRE